MKTEEVIRIIEELKNHHCELAVEAKSAQDGTPQKIYKTLSAFSNQSNGGIILLGVDEKKGFEVVGVNDPQREISEIGDVATAQMEPPICPDFTVHQIEGKNVVAVEIAEVSNTQKPCHYKNDGLNKGSYYRVGTSSRKMSEYMIYGYMSMREQPKFDTEVIQKASMEDFDHEKVKSFIENFKSNHLQATFPDESYEDILLKLRIIQMDNGTLRPTLAGLLMFGKYPQEFESQMVITFLQFPGIQEDEEGPRGERFIDNQKFEGPIPVMIENTIKHLHASIRKSSIIDGLFRREIPEYPSKALREAIINSVAHRDYSKYARGSYIQIRLFANRLEIQSPGGLYGYVTIDNIENEQSTRNPILMRMMEDMHLGENRGTGIGIMIKSMRDANLEPPQFEDNRSSFMVTFSNHTLMEPEAIEWLNKFSGLPLNDHQRVALVYLRHKRNINNSGYRHLNHVDSSKATKELQEMVSSNLIERNGTARGTFYTLKVSSEKGILPEHIKKTAIEPLKEVLPADMRKILDHIKKQGFIYASDFQTILNSTEVMAKHLLKKMVDQGIIRREGNSEPPKYLLVAKD